MVNLAKKRDTFEILKSVYDKPRLLYPILRALDDTLFDSSKKVIRSDMDGQHVSYALYTVLFQNFDVDEASQIKGIFTRVEKRLTRKGILPKSCLKSLRHATINIEIAEQTGIPHCHFVVYFIREHNERGVDLEFRRYLAGQLQLEAAKVNPSVKVRVNVSLGTGICAVSDGQLSLVVPKERRKQFWRAESYSRKEATQYESFSIKPFEPKDATWGFATRAILLGLVKAKESDDVWRIVRYVQEARKFGLRLLSYKRSARGIYLCVVGIAPRSTKNALKALVHDALKDLSLHNEQLISHPNFRMVVDYDCLIRLIRTGELSKPTAMALARSLSLSLPHLSDYENMLTPIIERLQTDYNITSSQQQFLRTTFKG